MSETGPKKGTENIGWEFGFKAEYANQRAWKDSMEGPGAPSKEEQIDIGIRLCIEKTKEATNVADVLRNPQDPTRTVLEGPFAESFKATAKEINNDLMRIELTIDDEGKKKITNSISNNIKENYPKEFLDGFAHVYKKILDKFGNTDKVKQGMMKLIMFQFVQASIVSSADNPDNGTKASNIFNQMYREGKLDDLSKHFIEELDRRLIGYKSLPKLSESEIKEIEQLSEEVDAKAAHFEFNHTEGNARLNTIYREINKEPLKDLYTEEVKECSKLLDQAKYAYNPKEMEKYLKSAEAIHKNVMTEYMFQCAKEGDFKGLEEARAKGANEDKETTNYKRGFFTALNDARKAIGKAIKTGDWKNPFTKPRRSLNGITAISSGKYKSGIVDALAKGISKARSTQAEAKEAAVNRAELARQAELSRRAEFTRQAEQRAELRAEALRFETKDRTLEQKVAPPVINLSRTKPKKSEQEPILIAETKAEPKKKAKKSSKKRKKKRKEAPQTVDQAVQAANPQASEQNKLEMPQFEDLAKTNAKIDRIKEDLGMTDAEITQSNKKIDEKLEFTDAEIARSNEKLAKIDDEIERLNAELANELAKDKAQETKPSQSDWEKEIDSLVGEIKPVSNENAEIKPVSDENPEDYLFNPDRHDDYLYDPELEASDAELLNKLVNLNLELNDDVNKEKHEKENPDPISEKRREFLQAAPLHKKEKSETAPKIGGEYRNKIEKDKSETAQNEKKTTIKNR